jgi:hypothetical protein
MSIEAYSNTVFINSYAMIFRDSMSQSDILNLDVLREKYTKLDSETKKLIRSMFMSVLTKFARLKQVENNIRKVHLSNLVNQFKDIGVIKVKAHVSISEIKVLNNKLYFVSERESEYKIKSLYQIYVLGSFLKDDLKTARQIKFPKDVIVFED